MMRNLLFLILFFLGACNSPASDQQPPVSVADSLQQLVIEGHDVAMAKMFVMQRQQKDLQARLDSLKKQPAGIVSENSLKTTGAVLAAVTAADIAMHHWMNGFKYDTLKDNPGAREQYLRQQLTTVNQMKDQVLSSVAAADSLLAATPAK
ncbi:viral A-type inclusion protein [Niabella terrae]